MSEALILEINYSLSAIESGNIISGIKEIISSFLSQIKELKSYDIPLHKSKDFDKFLGDIEFDFNDMINILLNYKQLDVDKLNQNDFKKILSFWQNYLENIKFTETLNELIKQSLDFVLKKQNIDKLRIKSIGFYFENFEIILINLELFYNFILNAKQQAVKFVLSNEYKRKVLQQFFNDAPLRANIIEKSSFVKKKIIDFRLSETINNEEVEQFIEKNLQNTKEAEITDEANIKEKKNTQEKNYPRPSFKYTIKKSKGIGLLINKLFSKPTGFFVVSAYQGTEFANSFRYELFQEQNEKKFFVKPFIDIANDFCLIFANTENLLKNLKIDSSVLQTKKSVQKNIFFNFYLLDKKISDFFYKFFIDIKNNGIFYTKNKAIAFYNMISKIANVYKKSILDSLLNYYTIQKDFLIRSNMPLDKINYYFDIVGVELSGLFMNITRDKKNLENQINLAY